MSTNPPSLALQHLYMVRAQLDLAIATVEALDQAVPVVGCTHPEEKRVDASVMDGSGTRWKCLLCDFEADGEV
jgi:hypothetical protein